MIDDDRPIFLQIAELIESDIVEGHLVEEQQVPSTNEFAVRYRINPATAAKGINRLVEEGILYKRRGIGMFVTTGARAVLLDKRKQHFVANYVEPMRAEARKIGISSSELAAMITRSETVPTSNGRRS